MPTASTSTRLGIKNILFTTDFSSTSEAALPYAQAFARAYGAKIFVGHVVRFEALLRLPMEPLPADFNLFWQDAQRRMQEFTQTHPMQEMDCETLLEQGDLLPVMCDFIEKFQIDLVVMATHGREGFKKFILGSSAEQIFRCASCPVLTVGPKAARPDIDFETFRNVLFATDFSAASQHAFPYALSIAEENQAHLVLLHLAPLIPVQNREAVQRQLKERLKAMFPGESEAWCDPEFLVRREFPAEGILAAAEEYKSDLIVLGLCRAAAPKLTAHLPGHIAYAVVRNAHCPVLTVRG
jgi:nucleotide-binding universal stress UspA family protein